MIHIIMGTKAQLIKMWPIMRILEEKKIPYNYIDTGQHKNLTSRLRDQFKIRQPDYELGNNKADISSNRKGIPWMFKILKQGFREREKIFKNDKNGLCLIHGDTISTLLAAILAKSSGQKIMHIEAGFRSQKLLKPFPEEIVRRLVDKWAKINIASKDDGVFNLKREKNKNRIFNVKENTLIDAVILAKDQKSDIKLADKYILVSIHRYETIHSKKRMKFIVTSLLELAKKNQIIWGLHIPTKNALKRFSLLKALQKNNNIELRSLFDYFEFIQAIAKSILLITDGGGPQDETKYLNIPCLLMRTENEKPGYHNVYDCDFKKEKMDFFIKNINRFRKKVEKKIPSPSKKIVNIIQRYL